ncbi:serine hydrolase domain-containing protein [Amycolatopsis sp.]|jgi:CubicO group peptidase (beta-lactamase class C family)|uniref:serine hydrolase domain-containing protein n=1 Tax=Amycolatopsis sp. TaxID=37632 RepID=UPI002E020A46|nr:serine hydrolase domain-containing protein [Amycolatopsis sp.]
MSSGGWSKARLGRMHDVMAGYVERGEVPGLVTLVSRRGETHVDVLGAKTLGGDDPMRRDTIFRIASITKCFAAAGAMMLVEECKLRLDEPVDRLLPELADRRVLKRIDGPVDDTVPANRPITLRDLLTFRLGMGMILGHPEELPIQRAIAELELAGFGAPNRQADYGPDEWMRRLSTLPLLHQPGERWHYNTGSYILGVLIARASGQSLETFLRERLFDPLGMPDTGFTVPAGKLDRFPAQYHADPESGELVLDEEAGNAEWSEPPAFPDAGGGMVSTVDDCFAFGRMMLHQGKLGGERVLSRASVEAMTTDHLTPEQKAVSGFFPGYFDTRGWGLGVSMVTKRDDVASSPGRFGWDGGTGTSWYTDPAEDLVAVLLTQRGAFPLASGVYLDFWTSVYQAIDD